ncbi:replication initiation protein, partial [Streptomyces javensis]|nr:replication initiation protein [Streptomyces javensis]
MGEGQKKPRNRWNGPGLWRHLIERFRMSPPYQPALFESSLPKWLACTDELAAGIQHHPRQKALKRAYIDPNPSALVWAMVFDVDRPEAATAWQDAPTECPRPNWVTQNPRNGHA